MTSTALQDRAASQASADRAFEEFKRTNRIILAGQPLASLTLHWEFPRAKQEFIDSLHATKEAAADYQANAQGETASSQGWAVENEFVFYPFLGAVTTGVFSKPAKPTLVLLSLDSYRNAVLSFGDINKAVTWGGAQLSSPVPALSGSVTYYEDLDAIWHGFAVPRARQILNAPSLISGVDEHSPSIEWDLDPVTLFNSVDKQKPEITLTANLPVTLEMIIFYNFHDLPFSTANFASSPGFVVWNALEEVDPSNSKASSDYPLLRQSILTLIPNGLTEQASRYEVKAIRTLHVLDSEYGEETGNDFLTVHFQQEEQSETPGVRRGRGIHSEDRR
jgi:hypothetical protein